MTKRFILLTAMASCVAVGASLNVLFAQNDSPSTWKALEKSYAQANLELAQARLAQAKSQNVAVKGSVSQGMLDELTAGVQLTQDRLKQLGTNAASNPYASANVDANLVNAWGVAFNPQGFVWVANNGTSTSTLYDAEGVAQSLVVSITAG